nr:hypothetical protein [Clostridia bacterium]
MLTDILPVLCGYLSQLGLPFYLADCVPKGARLPYLTADIQAPLRPGTEGSLTLTCWYAGERSNTQRLSHAGQLEEIIPARGRRLATGSGAVILIPEGGMQCVSQHGAQGVVLHYHLHFFANA